MIPTDCTETNMSEKLRESKESSTVRLTRRIILLVVFLTITGVGVPLFYITTTIYRADLPVEEIRNEAANLYDNIRFRIPVYLDIPNSLEYFTNNAQKVLDSSLHEKYPHLKNIWGIELIRSQSGVEDKDYIVKFEYVPQPENEEVPPPTESFFISPFSKTINLYITDAVVNSKKVDDFLKVVLLEQVFADELNEISKLINHSTTSGKDLVLPYSSKYNVVVSLLVENGKTVNWEIEKSTELLKPIFSKLTQFTNLTLSTQIQYYSTLTYPPTYDESKESYVIPENDLSTFINHGDWNLITHNINPSINFIIYFPESNYENKPLLVENSVTNSFLVPQWGGVYIFNKNEAISKNEEVVIREAELLPIMETFTSQLFELIGVPLQPKSPSIRIDSLSRITTLKNLKKSLDNLLSLVKLTDSLNEISIPELTKTYVLKTLDFLHLAFTSLENNDFSSAVTFSARSVESSDNAFFEKEMVQQAYFPSEHKLAVFLPLLGPVSSILIIGLIKTIKELKSEKLQSKKKEE